MTHRIAGARTHTSMRLAADQPSGRTAANSSSAISSVGRNHRVATPRSVTVRITSPFRAASLLPPCMVRKAKCARIARAENTP